MKIHEIHPALSWRLDMARAIAALFVLLEHVRNDYFVAYGDLQPAYQNAANFSLFFLSRLGHEAVMVFFVLSGFLVGGNAIKAHLEGTFQFPDYFLRRITRMYVVLVPCLLIGAVADLIRVHCFDVTVNGLTVSAFAGNLFFLQRITVPTFGGNPPLWSLANEFWYYLLWPPIMLVFQKGIARRAAVLVSLIFCCFIAPEIIQLFPLWIFGALLRLLPSLRLPTYLPTYAVALGLLMVSTAYSCWSQSIVGAYLTGITFGGVLLCWMFLPLREHKALPQLWKNLALFSFSLYALHYPLMKLLIAALNRYFNLGARNNTAGMLEWVTLAAIALLLIACGWLFYYAFERQTYIVRKRVQMLYPAINPNITT